MKDKKDFDEFDNVEAFIRQLDSVWVKQKRKELDKLSLSLGVSIEEHLTEELRQIFFGRETSPEEVDEEKTESFFLKTYRGKIGKKFKIICKTKLYTLTTKLNKPDHERVRDVVFQLSAEPSGSTLPNSHNPKYLKTLGGGPEMSLNISRVYGVKTKLNIIQYRVPTTKFRILWFSDMVDKTINILDFGSRDIIGKKLYH